MAKVVVVSEYTRASLNSTGYFWEKAIDRLIADRIPVETVTLSIPTQSTTRNNALFRLFRKMGVAFSLAFNSCLKVNKGDVVFSGTNPELLFLILAFLSKLLKFRWCVLVHDVFPENLVPAGIVTNNSIFYKALKGLFDWAYKQPEVMFVIGRDMQRLVEKKMERQDVVYIPNWVDAGKVRVKEKKSSVLIKSLGLSDRFVFQFFGNLGRLQGIDGLLKAIDLVENNNAAFLFVGNGVAAGKVKNYIKENPGKAVFYIDGNSLVDRDDGLAAADVSIISLEKGMYGLGVPSKTYFSMAADRPVLAIMDEGSEVSLMVAENEIGWSCKGGDPLVLAKKIEEICCLDMSVYQGKVRKVLEEKYSDRVLLDRLSSKIKSVIRAGL